MPQSSAAFSTPRRTPPLGLPERRAVVALLAPHVGKFDAWLKEAAVHNTICLAQVARTREQRRAHDRMRELAIEVEAFFLEFQRPLTYPAPAGSLILPARTSASC